MNVKELMEELSNYDGNLEVGYQTSLGSIELLIGEDPDSRDSGSIVIGNPGW